MSIANYASNQQRTSKTEEAYLELAEKLSIRFQKATGNYWRSHTKDFCEWLANNRYRWSKKTWRLYKAATMYLFEVNGFIEMRTYLKSFNQSACKKNGSGNTSSQKQKHLKTNDLDKLIETLAKTRGQHDKLIGLWLASSIKFGLRPTEWDSARIVGDWLVVNNAKATNNRSNGEVRSIGLSHAPYEEILLLKEFLNTINEHKNFYNSFNELHTRVRKRLHYICRKVWPKRKKYPTLYSCRHQFSADLKASGYTLEEIAALFGHATNRTASNHYGRKLNGKKGSAIVNAHAEEVATVDDKTSPPANEQDSDSRLHPSSPS